MGFLDKAFESTVIGGSGIVDQITGETGAEAAEEAAAIRVAEQRRQREISQQNLQPFLDVAQTQLPGLQEGATLPGFQQQIGAMTPQVQSLLAPIAGAGSAAANQALQGAGVGNQRAAIEAGGIDPSAILSLITGGAEEQFNRQLGLAGLGAGSGQTLSQLQLRAGQNIGSALGQGVIGGQQAQAAGAQNLLSVGTALLPFLSDFQLKNNIEFIGDKDGVFFYRWEWNERAKEFGLSGKDSGVIAQELGRKHPEALFIMPKKGYLGVNYAYKVNGVPLIEILEEIEGDKSHV